MKKFFYDIVLISYDIKNYNNKFLPKFIIRYLKKRAHNKINKSITQYCYECNIFTLIESFCNFYCATLSIKKSMTVIGDNDTGYTISCAYIPNMNVWKLGVTIRKEKSSITITMDSDTYEKPIVMQDISSNDINEYSMKINTSLMDYDYKSDIRDTIYYCTKSIINNIIWEGQDNVL